MKRTVRPTSERINDIIAKNSYHILHKNQRLGVVLGYQPNWFKQVIKDIEKEFDIELNSEIIQAYLDPPWYTNYIRDLIEMVEQEKRIQ